MVRVFGTLATEVEIARQNDISHGIKITVLVN